MAWDKTIPNESNAVRGASGDLTKIRENFVALDPIVVSGISGLVGVNLAGQTTGDVLRNSAGIWVPDTLEIGELNNVNAAGAAEGNVLSLSGSTWVPSGITIVATLSGLTDTAVSGAAEGSYLALSGSTWVASGVAATLSGLTDTAVSGAVSGQYLTWNGTAWVPITAASSGGSATTVAVVPSKRVILSLASGGTFATSNATDHQLSGFESRLASGVTVDLTSGTITVPAGVTHARQFTQLRWESNSSGDRRAWFLFDADARPGGDAEPRVGAGFSIIQAVNGTNTLQQAHTPWMPVTPGQKLKLYARQGSTGALNIEAGYSIGATGPVHQTYWMAEFGSISASGSVLNVAPKISVFSMASGASYSLSNLSQSIISGVTETVRNDAGLTLNSGTVTIPTASGYTHIRVGATIAFSGTASPTGQREILLFQDGGGLFYESGVPTGYFSYRTNANTTANAYTNLTLNTRLLALSGGDTTISLAASQGNGGALNVLGGAGAGWGGILTALHVECYNLTSAQAVPTFSWDDEGVLYAWDAARSANLSVGRTTYQFGRDVTDRTTLIVLVPGGDVIDIGYHSGIVVPRAAVITAFTMQAWEATSGNVEFVVFQISGGASTASRVYLYSGVLQSGERQLAISGGLNIPLTSGHFVGVTADTLGVSGSFSDPLAFMEVAFTR